MKTEVISTSPESLIRLNQLCWHDSVLNEIRLIRRNSVDQIVLDIELLQDYETQTSKRVKMIFENCRIAILKLHWGVVCISSGEMIGSAEFSKNGDLIEKMKRDWPMINFNEFAELHLTMGSTGSEIEFVFGSITYQPHENIAFHPELSPVSTV